MPQLAGLYETHLPVADLGVALEFYRDRLGLAVGRLDAERGSAFLFLHEGSRRWMLGIHECAVPPRAHPADRHVSFRFDGAPDALVEWLRQRDVEPLDNEGRSTEEPVVFAWMPAASVFFEDPDGNLLELLVELDAEPRPDVGVVPLGAWSAVDP